MSRASVTIAQRDHRKVIGYLRRQFEAERRYEFEAQKADTTYDVDPFTRGAYRRMLELYWTLSRVLAPPRRRSPAAQCIEEAPRPAPQQQFPLITIAPGDQPCIYVDVTDTKFFDKVTGIQRVVSETAHYVTELGNGQPVQIRGGLILAEIDGVMGRIEARPGDILLLLDAGWNNVDNYAHAISSFKEKGGAVVAGVYDLFPVLYPTLYGPELVIAFETWLSDVVSRSDAVVAISRCSATCYAEYAMMRYKWCRSQKIGWWRLGANLSAEPSREPAAAAIEIATQGPFFLCVGTVETRKGYPVAIEAFERLWADNIDVNLVIVGRPGWNARAFEQRLRQHEEKGRRLFWLDDASDADLRHLYRETCAAVFTTFAEGFGLPLVEAAQCGAPIIASDIPQFRELGGSDVRYFDLLDSASLADALMQALSDEKRPPRVATLTWRESTIELIGLLRSGAYQMDVSAISHDIAAAGLADPTK